VDVVQEFVFFLVGMEYDVAVSVKEVTVFVLRPFFDLEFFDSPNLNTGYFTGMMPCGFALSGVFFDFFFDVSTKESEVGCGNIDFFLL